PCELFVLSCVPAEVREYRVQRCGHDRYVDQKREHETEVLAEYQFRAAYRLGEQGVDASSLDFLRHQPDTDENRHEKTEHSDRRQTQVLEDLDVLAGGELSDEVRREYQENRKRDKAVHDLVAHGLAEAVDRNPEQRHCRCST